MRAKQVKPKKSGQSAMAECPKCRHRISKAATTCPDCGHPIGIVGWFTRSKIVLILTAMISVTGLSLFDIFSPGTTDGNIHPEKEVVGQALQPAADIGVKTTVVPCPDCEKYRDKYGTGHIECRECQGKTVKECPKCKGRKIVHLEKCSACGGTGEKPCTRCAGKGWLRCLRCGGKGHISKLSE